MKSKQLTMNHRIRKQILLIPFFLFTLYFNISAQTIVLRPADYREHNLWLNTTNPVGLLFNPDFQLSIAQAGFHFINGDLRTANQAPSIHQYSINSESYHRLNKIQLYGHIGYQNIRQNNRQWASTIQPANHMTNFGDSIPGRQTTETYNISGAIAFPLHPYWSAGGRIDYHARSATKNIDPRNKNAQTDLLAMPGILYNQQNFHLGTNFIYHRIAEEITYSFLNSETLDGRTFYPLWFYITENFENGMNNIRKYEANNYGGAIQLSIHGSKWEILNEFRYLKGREISHTHLYNKKGESECQEFTYNGQFRITGKTQQTFSPSFSHLKRTGFDNLQGKADNSNQQNQNDYGKTKRSAIITDRASLSYLLLSSPDSLTASHKIKARFDYDRQETFYFVYPAHYSQIISQYSFSAGYTRYLQFHRQSLEITTGAGYAQGHGRLPALHNNTGLPTPVVSISQETNLLIRDLQVSTAKTLKLLLDIQYTYHLNKTYALFGRGTANYHQGLSAGFGKHYRLYCGISAGILF